MAARVSGGAGHCLPGPGRMSRAIAVDQGFECQQNLADLPIPVVIMIARRTRLQVTATPCRGGGRGSLKRSSSPDPPAGGLRHRSGEGAVSVMPSIR